MNDSINIFLNSHFLPLIGEMIQSTKTLFEAPVTLKR